MAQGKALRTPVRTHPVSADPHIIYDFTTQLATVTPATFPLSGLRQLGHTINEFEATRGAIATTNTAGAPATTMTRKRKPMSAAGKANLKRFWAEKKAAKLAGTPAPIVVGTATRKPVGKQKTMTAGG
jgi:hypothetical protein